MVQLRGRLPGRQDPVQPGRQTQRQRRGRVMDTTGILGYFTHIDSIPGCVRQRRGGPESHEQAQAEHAEPLHRAVLRRSNVIVMWGKNIGREGGYQNPSDIE